MTKVKRMLAIFMTLAMVLSMTIAMSATAFAAEAKPADTSISVTGLETGDTVNFYQVLKFSENANATGGWVAATGFTSLTTDEIQKILGLGDYATGKPKANQAGIDATLAGKIAKMAQEAGKNAAKFKNVAVSGGAATQATTAVGDAGLYVALVTPGTTNYLYNPVFVGADYNAGGTNSQAAVTSLSYQPEALAKKEDVTFTKEINGAENTKYDVNVGDTVGFTINSKVPAFSSAYQNPTYIITDTTEEGLEIQGTPVVAMAGLTGNNALVAADYTVAVNANKRSFTVTLNDTGLAKVRNTGVAQDITVTYSAKVTSLEDATVTEKENEANVKFSNNPEDSSKYSLLEDKTRTYSFTIDGNLLGYDGTSYETDELIKVGLNADGTPATEKKKYHSGTTWTELSPLGGAEFTLYTDSGLTTPYSNSKITNGKVQSDGNGRIKIEGLDAGVYYLKETSAPAGYIADDRTFTITIAAEYETINAGEYTNSDGIKVKYDAYKVLKKYTVTVNDGTNNVVSTYNIENKGPVDHKVVDKATYQTITGEHFAGDSVTPINNTKGTELPSTGGIGTVIFYVLGAALVIGCGVVLVSRRRIQDNK